MTSMVRVMVFVLMLAGGSALHANIMLPMSVAQLATNAEVIVHGTVRSKTVQRDPEGRIYTVVELNIHEIWKGNISRKDFRLVHGGGILGTDQAAASAQVEYEIGEEVVAYLRLNQRGEGVTLGLVQGKFHVETDAQSREKFASNVFHGQRARGSPAGGDALTMVELKRRTQGGKP